MDRVPPTLVDEPASYRLAYLVIANADHRLTLEDVISRTKSARPTIKRALATLQRRGLVDAKEHRADGRRKWYTAAADVDADTERTRKNERPA